MRSVGAFIDGQHMPTAGLDVDSHGSHVAGTIGARSADGSRFGGVAPGAEVVAARVFPGPGSGANQADIVNAIDYLSRIEHVDLINLSLGAPRASQIEHDSIIDARERGTVCLCAAANSAGPVEYPAAFPESVAISALGLLGSAPVESLSATRVPEDSEMFGQDNLYLANFSCFGPEVNAAAPGVGIIATVPSRFDYHSPFGVMDGTSMASPVACAALAVALSGHPGYLSSPRSAARSSVAISVLNAICRDIGLKAEFQGRGAPWVAASTPIA